MGPAKAQIEIQIVYNKTDHSVDVSAKLGKKNAEKVRVLIL